MKGSTRWILGLVWLLAAGCDRTIIDPLIYGTSERTALGALDLAGPAELQAFGFRTEATFPAGSGWERVPYDLLASATLYPEWEGAPDGTEHRGPSVWSVLNGCDGEGQSLRAEDVLEAGTRGYLPMVCEAGESQELLLVVGRDGRDGVPGDTVTSAVVASLGAFSGARIEEDPELRVTPQPVWRRTQEGQERVLEVPAGTEDLQGPPLTLRVDTAEDVVVVLSVRVVGTSFGDGEESPRLTAWVHAGFEGLPFSGLFVDGTPQVRSVALEEDGAGVAGHREWPLQVSAHSNIPLSTALELRWAVTVDVFGLGEEAPSDLELEVAAAGG